MKEARIDVRPMKLATMLNLMAQGQLQVPRFQREFVWPLTKTRALLDSMFKEYPIGTFFFWQAPPEQRSLFRELPDIDIPQPEIGVPVSFILDGQQRLTSLFVTINGLTVSGRDYGRICIDLETAARFEAGEEEEAGEDDESDDARIFVGRKPDNRRYIAFTDLLRENNYEIYDQIPKEWRPTFTEAANRFKTYPLSVVWVKDQGLDEVVDIFQRINQGGKRLSRYDLVCANLWEPSFDFRSEVQTFNESLERNGFGAIDGTIVTQAFSLVIQDRCTTAAELKLETADVREKWTDVIKSLRLAVDFVRSNFGVERYDFLPYRGILAVLADFFYHAPKSAITAQQRDVLWQWFWGVTLSERYGSTSPSRMAEDAKKLRDMLQSSEVRFDYPSKVTADGLTRTRMTAASSALRNAVLCLLALRQPRNLKDGSLIDLKHPFFSNLKEPERHHIFPVAFLRDQNISTREVHAVPNFCFVPADLNKEISAKQPSVYMATYRNENPQFVACAATHIIPVDASSPVWTDSYRDFLRTRAELLATALNEMVSQGPSAAIAIPESQKRTSDNETVTEIELRLRDLIDSHLTAVAGENYWKQAIPGGTKNKAKLRIEAKIEKHPYETWADYPPGRKRLDLVDVGDYQDIVLYNFDNFKSIFGKREAFEQHMAAFRELRNATAHNSTLNEVQRKLADGAVAWLHQILDRYDEQMRADASAGENGTVAEDE